MGISPGNTNRATYYARVYFFSARAKSMPLLRLPRSSWTFLVSLTRPLPLRSAGCIQSRRGSGVVNETPGYKSRTGRVVIFVGLQLES